MSAKKSIENLKVVLDFMVKSKGFDKCLEKIKITGGGNGECLAEFTVAPEHLNRMGGLHGGFTATVVDNMTTCALLSKEPAGLPGVSVDLHVSYLKGAREGEEIIVDSKTVKAGRILAYLECELRRKKDGVIIAKGSQTKYVGAP